MKHPQLEVRTRSLGKVSIDERDHLAFDREKLDRANFSGLKLKSFGAHGSAFNLCDFSNMRIDGASLGSGEVMSTYVDCSFDNSRMRMGPGGFARFERCSFRNVVIRDWICFSVEIVDCVFSGKLQKAIFNGTPHVDDQSVLKRARNEFQGNDFSHALLEDVSFRTGIDLGRQILPTSPDYVYLPHASAAVGKARAEVIAWPASELRRIAMIIINTLEDEIRGGQEQLLLRQGDYEKSFKASAAKVLDLLRGAS
jgi:hypothetical protein